MNESCSKQACCNRDSPKPLLNDRWLVSRRSTPRHNCAPTRLQKSIAPALLEARCACSVSNPLQRAAPCPPLIPPAIRDIKLSVHPESARQPVLQLPKGKASVLLACLPACLLACRGSGACEWCASFRAFKPARAWQHLVNESRPYFRHGSLIYLPLTPLNHHRIPLWSAHHARDPVCILDDKYDDDDDPL
jgi:hypothetical protein